MNKAHVLVLAGDGLNCEAETLRAFQKAGAKGEIMHINDLLKNPSTLKLFNILAIPGGFSFGDEISSGQILALKLKKGLKDEFEKFISGNNLVIGICNGFQTLVKLGVFGPKEERYLTLTHNRQQHFIDRWVELTLNPSSNCVWTKNMPPRFSLPIRHGEGKIVLKGDDHQQTAIFNQLNNYGQIAMSYLVDENGSYEKIAGLCDPTGRIFGLMPHPEAAINEITKATDLKKMLKDGIGLLFFKNAVDYIQQQA
jgi:phosphoribosylformylglycinamidine synthase subunit PurQ / glutaminase